MPDTFFSLFCQGCARSVPSKSDRPCALGDALQFRHIEAPARRQRVSREQIVKDQDIIQAIILFVVDYLVGSMSSMGKVRGGGVGAELAVSGPLFHPRGANGAGSPPEQGGESWAVPLRASRRNCFTLSLPLKREYTEDRD